MLACPHHRLHAAQSVAQRGRLERCDDAVADRAAVECAAIGATEDEVLAAGEPSPPPKRQQDLPRLPRQRDRPDPPRLGARVHVPGKRARDRDHLRPEVDILPPQCTQLAQYAGRRRRRGRRGPVPRRLRPPEGHRAAVQPRQRRRLRSANRLPPGRERLLLRPDPDDAPTDDSRRFHRRRSLQRSPERRTPGLDRRHLIPRGGPPGEASAPGRWAAGRSAALSPSSRLAKATPD
jgi:hypothetical protein